MSRSVNMDFVRVVCGIGSWKIERKKIWQKKFKSKKRKGEKNSNQKKPDHYGI